MNYLKYFLSLCVLFLFLIFFSDQFKEDKKLQINEYKLYESKDYYYNIVTYGKVKRINEEENIYVKPLVTVNKIFKEDDTKVIKNQELYRVYDGKIFSMIKSPANGILKSVEISKNNPCCPDGIIGKIVGEEKYAITFSIEKNSYEKLISVGSPVLIEFNETNISPINAQITEIINKDDSVIATVKIDLLEEKIDESQDVKITIYSLPIHAHYIPNSSIKANISNRLTVHGMDSEDPKQQTKEHIVKVIQQEKSNSWVTGLPNKFKLAIKHA